MNNSIELVDVIFVDCEYSHKHPHMIHRHENFLELLYIAEESGRYIVAGHEYAVTAGDFVVCNPHVPHGEDPFQEHHIQTYCLVLSGAQLELAEDESPIVSTGREKFFGELMPQIYHTFHKRKGWSEVCRHFAAGIFFMVQRLILERVVNPKQKRERLVHRITDYLNEHFTEPLTLKKISEEFFISESSLSHAFKKETGLSPMQYVMQRRIGQAQSLLVETLLAIQEIEFQLGFSDSAHFSKLFKKYVGVTPKEYRAHFAGRRRRS